MAGESAQEQARRQRAKAARLIESAERWEQGAVGEAAVAAALSELQAAGWTLLHDLAWPGRKHANLDHVAIGDGRVFVIDAKNWTGDVATAGGVLRQNGRSRAKEVAAVAEAARVVAELVPGLPATTVRPVLCLVRDDWFSERFGEVLVCSSHNLVAQLRGQPMTSEPLSPAQFAQLIEKLRAHGTAESHARPRAGGKGVSRKGARTGTLVKMTTALAALTVRLRVCAVNAGARANREDPGEEAATRQVADGEAHPVMRKGIWIRQTRLASSTQTQPSPAWRRT